MKAIKAISSNAVLKIQIYKSESSQAFELKNLDTEEQLRFSDWKQVSQYLESKALKQKKGLR